MHPASEHIPVTRANGITHTLALPGGGGGWRSVSAGFPGQGSVFNLAGWTIEEMEITPGAVMVMNWPSLRTSTGGRFGFGPVRERSFREVKEEYDRAVHNLREWLEQARGYDRAVAGGARIPRDLRLEALARAAKGELPVLVRVDQARDIRDVVAFAEKEGLKLIDRRRRRGLQGRGAVGREADSRHPGPDAGHAAQPRSRPTPSRTPTPACSTPPASRSRSPRSTRDSRTLPYEAAMATGFGLPRDVALRAVTLNPAEILGLGDQLGSIEAGKIANLIVTDGDPLEITTQIKHLIIGGRETSTDNKHQQLYQKYRARPKTATKAGT